MVSFFTSVPPNSLTSVSKLRERDPLVVCSPRSAIDRFPNPDVDDSLKATTMLSPFIIGSVLIVVSVTVMLLPLTGPLISLCIHLINDYYFLVPSSLDDDVSSTMNESKPSIIVLQLYLSKLMEHTFKSVYVILHVLKTTIELMPQLAASGMIAYLGICVGYVGLVHLGCINPDKAMIRR
jgi:hypothetical protein